MLGSTGPETDQQQGNWTKKLSLKKILYQLLFYICSASGKSVDYTHILFCLSPLFACSRFYRYVTFKKHAIQFSNENQDTVASVRFFLLFQVKMFLMKQFIDSLSRFPLIWGLSDIYVCMSDNFYHSEEYHTYYGLMKFWFFVLDIYHYMSVWHIDRCVFPYISVSTNKELISGVKNVRQTRPGLPMVTLIWHASKYAST